MIGTYWHSEYHTYKVKEIVENFYGDEACILWNLKGYYTVSEPCSIGVMKECMNRITSPIFKIEYRIKKHKL